MSRAIVTVGLGYGDEGKGSIVDYLVRHHGADLVVRYSGGCQAAHNVVLPDGRWHTFAQFGAGTFAGARTWLHKNMIIDPFAMVREAEHLKTLGIVDPFSLLSVHPKCLVTTPFHVDANRYRETLRGEQRHGSCGMGIGECRSYAIHNPDSAVLAEDIFKPKVMVDKLTAIRDYFAHEFGDGYEQCIPADVVREYSDKVPRLRCDEFVRCNVGILEGSQGIMLDETVGIHPWTTWSDVTLNASKEALYDLQITDHWNLGITRCFATRHGPGPFPTEIDGRTVPTDHNQRNEWQGTLRVGRLDPAMLGYAAKNAGGRLHGIALTWLDWQPEGCEADELDFVSAVEAATGSTVKLLSRGPTWQHKYHKEL